MRRDDHFFSFVTSILIFILALGFALDGYASRQPGLLGAGRYGGMVSLLRDPCHGRYRGMVFSRPSCSQVARYPEISG